MQSITDSPSAFTLSWPTVGTLGSTTEPEAGDIIRSEYANWLATFRGGENMVNSKGVPESFSQLMPQQLLGFAVYVASNNLLSPEYTDQLLEFNIENIRGTMLASLLRAKIPTTEVFAKYIFECALCIPDTNVVKICLDAGIDPNRACQYRVKFVGNHIKPNAIQIAVRNGDPGLVKFYWMRGPMPITSQVAVDSLHSKQLW
jgi:hypothetical protein